MKRFFLILLSLVPLFGFSQSNFQPGYIVTNEKDTITGKLDYRENLNNPSAFNFRANNGFTKKYDLSNCIAYGINNLAAFERHNVSISLSKNTGAYLSVGPDTNTLTKPVFLQVLQKGSKVVLYSYRDKIKNRFYIKDPSTSIPFELIRQLYFREDKAQMVVTDNKYRTQLVLTIENSDGDYADFEKMLTQLPYEENALKKLVAKINDQEVLKSKNSRIRTFIGLGVVGNTTSYEGEVALAGENVKNIIKCSPYLHGGFDFLFNPNIGKLLFRVELAVFKTSHEMVNENPTAPASYAAHNFESLNAVFTPQIIYHFYNGDPLKVYGSVGTGFNISKFSKDVYNLEVTNVSIVMTQIKNYTYRDETPFQNLYYSFPVSVGLVFKKKYELIASYTYKTRIATAADCSISVERFKVGVNYLFGKH
ncbi:MAG: hypothetical protein V4687_19065 [Bacteroidota bacterium]